MTESDSDDEVVIHNSPHTIPSSPTEVAFASASRICEEDNMTLLALAKPAMARKRLKRKAQAPRVKNDPVRIHEYTAVLCKLHDCHCYCLKVDSSANGPPDQHCKPACDRTPLGQQHGVGR